MQLLAYADLTSIADWSLSIIDYVAATYIARGPKVANSYAKFNKLVNYALGKVQDATWKRLESTKIDGAGGSQGMEDNGKSGERPNTVCKLTMYAREAD